MLQVTLQLLKLKQHGFILTNSTEQIPSWEA